LKVIRVETCDKVAAGWDEALAAKTPCVIEFHTDPEVPPLPPHITAEQAKNFMKSLLHDPNRAQMIKESFKSLFAGLKSSSS
jgi:pyruvate dehydrogenase (quinone)